MSSPAYGILARPTSTRPGLYLRWLSVPTNYKPSRFGPHKAWPSQILHCLLRWAQCMQAQLMEQASLQISPRSPCSESCLVPSIFVCELHAMLCMISKVTRHVFTLWACNSSKKCLALLCVYINNCGYNRPDLLWKLQECTFALDLVVYYFECKQKFEISSVIWSTKMTDTTNNYQSHLAFHFFSIGTFVVSETVPMIMFMYIHME